MYSIRILNLININFKETFTCALSSVPNTAVSTWYYSTASTGPYYQLEAMFKKVITFITT